MGPIVTVLGAGSSFAHDVQSGWVLEPNSEFISPVVIFVRARGLYGGFEDRAAFPFLLYPHLMQGGDSDVSV